MSLSRVWQDEIKHVFVFPCRSARSHVCSYSWIPTLSQAASANLWHHSKILRTNLFWNISNGLLALFVVGVILAFGFWPSDLRCCGIWWYSVVYLSQESGSVRFNSCLLLCLLSSLSPHLTITSSFCSLPLCIWAAHWPPSLSESPICLFKPVTSSPGAHLQSTLYRSCLDSVHYDERIFSTMPCPACSLWPPVFISVQVKTFAFWRWPQVFSF